MADRRIEWQIALDSAGVSKGVKGIDAELSAMRKAFDSLQNVKAFDAQLAALNDLASKIEAAKAKAAALASAAATGGKAAQNAYASAAYEVTRLEQSLRSQTSAVAASAAALDKAGISTKDLTAETARVADEYKAAAAAAGQAAKAQEAWFATGVRSTKQLEAEIAKLQQLTKSGLLDERGIAAAEARIESLNKELGRTPPAAQQSAGALSKLTKEAAGLAAAYLSIESAKQAITITAEFGDELQAVAAFSGATAAEMAKLRQNALDLAGAAGGPRAIAAGMADLAASGASASEIMGATGIVRDMAAASKGTLDFAKAGDLLTNVLKMYGKQITDAQPVADRLVTGWSSAGQTAADLEMSIKEVGSTFSNLYGYLGNTAPLEKTIATLSVMAETSFKGEKGGTALKTALKNLIAPAGEAEKTLAKYADTIKIFDDAGNMRDFADIIDDIGKSGLSSGEMFNLFGDSTAAMTALVNLGGNSIRNMEAKLKSADGTAANVQKTMQDGLGGAIREATAEIEKAAIVFTDEFAPAIRSVLGTAKLATPALQLLTGEIKAIAAAANLGAAGVFSLLRPFEWLAEKIGLASKETNYWKDNASAAFASAKDLAGQSAAAYNAATGKVNELVEAQERLDSINSKVSSRFNEISQATGVTVNTMQELDAAVAAGKIKWDDATSSWIGSEKQKQEAVAKTAVEATAAAELAAEAEAEARKVAEKSWEEYGNQVQKIAEEIYNKTKSLDEQLKEMARSGMSAAEAQKAIKQEAEAAYASAVKLAEAGNYKGAREAAEAAKSSWADVAGNVRQATEEVDKTKESLDEATKKLGELKEKASKDGIISESELESIDNAKEKISELKAQLEENTAAVTEQKAALAESMAGVKAAGELEIEILQKQKDEYQSLADQLDDAFDFSSAGEQIDKFIEEKLGGVSTATTAAAESVKTSMDASATSVAAASERITASVNAIPSSKEITITEKYVQARAGGGAIGTVTAMATGGMYARDARRGMHFPGFGGGDRWSNLVIAENGEYMQRKEATAALGGDGLALARAQNNLDFVRMQSILTKHLGPPQIKLDMPAPRQPQMQQLGVIKLQVGDVQAEVYATPDNAAAIHAAIAEAQRRAQHTANARRRAGAK